MPNALIERLRARGFVPPDYDGGGLVNVAATVLDVLGVRDETDPPPLRALEPSLREGVRQVVVVLADGLGFGDNGKAGLMTRGLAEVIRLGTCRAARSCAAHRGDHDLSFHDRCGDHDFEYGADAAGARQHRVLHLARGVRGGHTDAPLGPSSYPPWLILR